MSHTVRNVKKALKRLGERQTSYEETCKRRLDHGKGFRRPGSMKKR